MAKKNKIEAMPILISSTLGLLYVLFFIKGNDIVLIAIFLLLILRSLLGLLKK